MLILHNIFFCFLKFKTCFSRSCFWRSTSVFSERFYRRARGASHNRALLNTITRYTFFYAARTKRRKEKQPHFGRLQCFTAVRNGAGLRINVWITHALLSREKHAFNTVILRVLSRIFVLRFHYDTRETYFTRAPPAVVLARARVRQKKNRGKEKKKL